MSGIAMRRRPVNGRKDELLKQPGADSQDAAVGLLPEYAEPNSNGLCSSRAA